MLIGNSAPPEEEECIPQEPAPVPVLGTRHLGQHATLKAVTEKGYSREIAAATRGVELNCKSSGSSSSNLDE